VIEEVQTLNIAGTYAASELNRLRKEFAQTGLYPVLFGDQTFYEELIERGRIKQESSTKTTEGIISQSLEIDVPAWFREQLEQDPEYYRLEQGDWPTETLNMGSGLRGHIDSNTGQLLNQVVIGLISVKNPWEIFATLQWGGWNSCPQPEEHCAIHRYWFNKYGVQVVGITHDSLDCFVTKPPESREECLHLARELTIYNGEFIESGIGTLSNIAAMLSNSKFWYFWWD
jgi:Domain of unknown function (DUF4253)